MLPSELLIVRRRYPWINPKYLLINEKSIILANDLIRIFQQYIGRKKKLLIKKIKEIEDSAFSEGFDYRVPRGLAHLLLRKSVFEQRDVKVDPFKLRKELFRIVNEKFRGFVLSEEEKKKVYSIIAKKYNILENEIETIFTSTFEEEYILKDFEKITAIELIKEYNLSLTQTLLFKALFIRVDLLLDGYKAKKILYNAKRLGLMYFAEKIENDYNIRLTIDGPISMLKQTERYGTRLAKLLPFLLSASRWRIDAVVKYNNKKYKFLLSDSRKDLFPKKDIKLVEYDSSVEEYFYKRFKTLGSNWIIKREPEPLLVDNHIFIPDFSFECNDVKVYLEIMGFWTPDYLRRKITKLSKVKDVNLIIAVQESFAGIKEVKSLPHDIIVYKNKLPSVEVYKALKKYMPISVKSIENKSTKLQIDPAVKMIIANTDNTTLSNLLNKLKKYNVSQDDLIWFLEEEGFEIVWNSLDPNNIIVRRKTFKKDQTTS